MSCGIFLALCVAILSYGGINGSFVTLAPKIFRPGHKYSVQVSISGTESVVNVEAKITVNSQSTLVTKTESFSNDESRSIPLMIPDSVPDGSYKLEVEGSGGLTFQNSTPITLNKENGIILIQTDKAIYKPNQKVRMRVFTVSTDLDVIKRPTDITVFDKNGNRIQSWKGETSPSGVITKDFDIADLPPLGDWEIRASNQGGDTSKKFKVDKYVLPRFEVKTELIPDHIIQGKTESFTVKVNAKYTYGKGVPGTAKIILGGGDLQKIEPVEKELSGSGMTEVSFDVSRVLKKTDYIRWYRQEITVTVNVTEKHSDVTEMAESIMLPVFSHPVKLSFMPGSPSVFRVGLPLKVYVKVTDAMGKRIVPEMTGKTVIFKAYFNYNSPTEQSVTIPKNGEVMAEFVIPVNFEGSSLRIQAGLQGSDLKNVETSAYLNAYQTKLKKMIKVMIKSNQPVAAGSAAEFTVKTTSASISHVVYMVIARGVISKSGKISMNGQMEKTESFITSRDMAPKARVLVYAIVEDGGMKELIADSDDLEVSGVFKNEVTLTFSAAEKRAGENVDLTVKSDANSYFFVLAVDQSVLLLQTGNDITQSGVISDLGKFDLEEKKSMNPDVRPVFRGKRSIFLPEYRENGPRSAGALLKARGVIYLTDMVVEDVSQDRFFHGPVEDGMIMRKESVLTSVNTQPTGNQFADVKHVRQHFPEAWLWFEGTTNNDGISVTKQKVPDTITTWMTTCFALSTTKGLAITPAAVQMRSFQPFYISLALPYAVRRGENFRLRITLFNYMKVDSNVQVTLAKSEEFMVVEKVDGVEKKESKDVVEQVFVKKDATAGISIWISPSKLGNIMFSVTAKPEKSTGEPGDQVKRPLLVKPEGIVYSNVEPFTIELKDSVNTFAQTVNLNFPSHAVPGSRRIEVKVTGDVMGPALDGLDHLLQQPTGCGEQNMITMVPNIFVTKYLKSVGRLTMKVKNKAVKFMTSGYQRELGYKHKDGSFSAFGEGGGQSGSTWLTAFVMKSFSQAKDYIMVDPAVQEKALKWLAQQRKLGMFKLVGQVHHLEMLGGSSAGNALTAFVLIALKESESFFTGETKKLAVAVMDEAKVALENLVTNEGVTQTYQKAIIGYALTLVGSSVADGLITSLQAEKKPWDKAEVPPTLNAKRAMMYTNRATSSDIETWSYFLLSCAHKKDIACGRETMKWLLKNQNGRGGFVSTQDTVLGLQSLSEYAVLVFSDKDTDIDVSVKAGGKTNTFKVDTNKVLLMQSAILSPDVTSVEVSAKGKGLVVAKVLWQYNSLEKEESKGKTGVGFIVSATTSKKGYKIAQIRACSRISKTDLGMIVMRVQLPTGLVLDNMDALMKIKDIRRVEEKDSTVNIYYDEPTSTDRCADIDIRRVEDITNLQPAAMSVEAYYQSEYKTEVMYSVDELKMTDICKACGDDCPKSCPVNGATHWTVKSFLLTGCVCVLLSLVMAV